LLLNGTDGTVKAEAVNAASISFGSEVVFNAGTTNSITATFDSTSNKVVIAYQDVGNSSYGTSIVGTVSGTSISFGSETVFESAATLFSSATFDSNLNKVVIAYRDDGNSSYGTAIVGTVSGTSISFGSAVIFENSRADAISAIFDSSNNKVVIAYQDPVNTDAGTAIVGTVSGTSISFGTAVVIDTNFATVISATFDSSSNKVVVAYQDSGNSNYGTAVVGTVSGTSISFGTPVAFNNAGNTLYLAAVFDSVQNLVVISFRDDSVANSGTVIAGQINGDSISFGSKTVYNSTSTDIAAVFDVNASATVSSYYDGTNSNYGTASVASPSFTNNTSFIGITAEAISDTATGPVNVYGGINTTAKGPITTAVGTRSTFNSTSYTSYPDMVYDEANQKVIVVYRQETGTSYPMGVVGTVSGTSLSWGTPVVLRSTSTKTGGGPRVVYDPNTEKVLVSCLPSNVAQGQIVVCTVSGTSISPGSVNVWDTGILEYQSMAYDTANARVVIAYKYNTAPATDDGYAVVGTVSGDSISFGSRVLFDSGSMSYPSTAYDSNTGKIVIAYNSGGPKAIVGTVSGTSISFGSITTITMTTPNMTYSDLVYDAGNQKVVFVTRKSAVPTSGLALVGTVSGTSISFGTEVAFTTDGINYMAATYDSTLGKVAICYEESATDDGKMVLGTVSGTSISFTSPVTFESTTSLDYVTAATYDPNEQVVVAGYTDDGVPVYGRATAISVTAPLTIGSDYYVQNDGSLSTTASSVKAGQAISATTINMMDLT
jgi:hypothetical protein